MKVLLVALGIGVEIKFHDGVTWYSAIFQNLALHFWKSWEYKQAVEALKLTSSDMKAKN
jgi:hypothetical protein